MTYGCAGRGTGDGGRGRGAGFAVCGLGSAVCGSGFAGAYSYKIHSLKCDISRFLVLIDRVKIMGNYKELIVWQEAKDLSVKIYNITEQGSFKKNFSFKDQIRRAAVSIPSRIPRPAYPIPITILL